MALGSNVEANEMRSSAVVSIDLSTEDLLQDSSAAAQVEIDDVSAFAPPRSDAPSAPKAPAPAATECDDSVEIELTSEQIDALLSGRP
jgi:hypothetical protein